MTTTAERSWPRTTGIGSLPHRDIGAALDFSFRMGIPFLPELPSLSPNEGMLGPSCLKETRLAWKPFVDRLRDFRPKQAKLQIPGPFTLREIPVSDFLNFARPMIDGISDLGIEPILFIDEPGLFRFSEEDLPSLERFRALLNELRPSGARLGIHCCGQDAPWEILLDWELDYLSFDCSLALETILRKKPQALAFQERGGCFALGVVPTDKVESAPGPAAEIFARFESILSKELPDPSERRSFLSRALFTPACGLALHSVNSAQVTLERLMEFYEICETSL